MMHSVFQSRRSEHNPVPETKQRVRGVRMQKQLQHKPNQTKPNQNKTKQKKVALQ
jgi:hypothetical protein